MKTAVLAILSALVVTCGAAEEPDVPQLSQGEAAAVVTTMLRETLSQLRDRNAILGRTRSREKSHLEVCIRSFESWLSSSLEGRYLGDGVWGVGQTEAPEFIETWRVYDFSLTVEAAPHLEADFNSC